MNDIHGPAAENVTWTNDERIADFFSHSDGFIFGSCRSVRRLTKSQLLEKMLEPLTVFSNIDGVGCCSDNLDAVSFQSTSQFQRSLPAVLNDNTFRFFDIDNLQHIFESDRFEIESVAGIVVSGDCFRIAVDHNGLIAVFAESHCCVNAAVIEFDTLSDSVRTAAEHHDLAAVCRIRFIFFLVSGVHVSGIRREFSGTSINSLVYRANAQRMTIVSDIIFFNIKKLSQSSVRESFSLQEVHFVFGDLIQRSFFDSFFDIYQFFNLSEEPRVDLCRVIGIGDAVTETESICQIPQSFRSGFTDFMVNGSSVG